MLIGEAKLEDAVQKWGPHALRVLTSGLVPPNPSELLASPAMTELLAEARSSYDVVVIDTSALLAVTDGAVAASRRTGSSSSSVTASPPGTTCCARWRPSAPWTPPCWARCCRWCRRIGANDAPLVREGRPAGGPGRQVRAIRRHRHSLVERCDGHSDRIGPAVADRRPGPHRRDSRPSAAKPTAVEVAVEDLPTVVSPRVELTDDEPVPRRTGRDRLGDDLRCIGRVRAAEGPRRAVIQLAAWLLVCLATAWLLRRRPVLLASLAVAVWTLVPAIAGYRITGEATGPLGAHPSTYLVLCGLLVQVLTNPRLVAAVLARYPVVVLVVGIFVVGAAGTSAVMSSGVSRLLLDQIVAPFVLWVLVVAGATGEPRRLLLLRNVILVAAVVQCAIAAVQRRVEAIVFYPRDYARLSWFDPDDYSRWMGTADSPLVFAALLCVAAGLSLSLRRSVVRVPLLVLFLVGTLIAQARAGTAVLCLILVYAVLRPTMALWARALTASSSAGRRTWSSPLGWPLGWPTVSPTTAAPVPPGCGRSASSPIPRGPTSALVMDSRRATTSPATPGYGPAWRARS